MNQYEAMFLFDPTFGASFENCETEIRRLMERAQAEIVFCKKWDERRLAYKVKGRKRGLYVLAYFKAPADRIGPLERDCQISENILRVLVLRADGVTEEMMEKIIAAHGTDTTPDVLAKRGLAPGGDPGALFTPGLADLADYGESERRGDRGGRRGGRRPAAVEAPQD